MGKIAETFNKLMLILGYTEYVAQGGDWGSSVVRLLGQRCTNNCRSVHVNVQMDSGRSPSVFMEPLVWLKMKSPFYDTSKEVKEMIDRTKWFDVHERAYRVWSFFVEAANG